MAWISRRGLFIIMAIVVGVALIIALLWWFFWRQPAVPVNTNTQGQPPVVFELPTANSATTTVNGTPSDTAEPVSIDVATVETIARSFSERYGSYSNHNQFVNVQEVESLTTTGFYALLRDQQPASNSSGAYYGVTTKALSQQVRERTADHFIVAVKTQQVTSSTNAPDQIAYPTLTLTIVYQNGQWLVDGAVWER